MVTYAARMERWRNVMCPDSGPDADIARINAIEDDVYFGFINTAADEIFFKCLGKSGNTGGAVIKKQLKLLDQT